MRRDPVPRPAAPRSGRSPGPSVWDGDAARGPTVPQSAGPAGRSPPALLSLTGAFADLRSLAPSAGLIPYDLIVPFWSDGAAKRRWISVPSGPSRIRVHPNGEWTFPAGTVFVKHFEIACEESRPDVMRAWKRGSSWWMRVEKSGDSATDGATTDRTPIS